VNGIDVRDLSRRDDAIHQQITQFAGAGANANRLISETDVHGLVIRLGIDGDRLDAEFLAGANDTQSDFATIGDEYFVEHWA
jgi:hypothetical protein